MRRTLVFVTIPSPAEPEETPPSMASTSLTATTAVSATTFASSLGINTHIDFATYGYQNLANVESDIHTSA